MPLVALALVLVFTIAMAPVLVPLSLIQRYRVGTRRQPARGWLATLNLLGLTLSASILLAAAAVVGLWLERALPLTLVGLVIGAALGFLGLALTRWQPDDRSLYFTPNRWLVLTIMTVVLARLLYGFWRGWQTWGASGQTGSWLAETGVAGSLAAGGIIIGYYWIYWAGVRRRLQKHRGQRHRGQST